MIRTTSYAEGKFLKYFPKKLKDVLDTTNRKRKSV